MVPNHQYCRMIDVDIRIGMITGTILKGSFYATPPSSLPNPNLFFLFVLSGLVHKARMLLSWVLQAGFLAPRSFSGLDLESSLNARPGKQSDYDLVQQPCLY